MIALSRTKTDRVVRTRCICGETIDVHGQIDAEYVETLPTDGREWVCAQHEENTAPRTRTKRMTA